jgi:hypothetical protein
MTSTTGGSDAPSFGWSGRAAIESGARQPHMNTFGGEDRFWLGPEGGQYALYFKPGDPFDLDHWQVPEPIDWGAWDVASQSTASVRFHKRMSLTNYAKTTLDVDVVRRSGCCRPTKSARSSADRRAPRYAPLRSRSSNGVTNAGRARWEMQSGLVSIWILGMFNRRRRRPSRCLRARRRGHARPIVNDAYFGKVPADRLVVKPSAVLFRGDGQYRSKIGLSPSRAMPIAGSYDAASHTLTLVQYTRPPKATGYVNSMWEIQKSRAGRRDQQLQATVRRRRATAARSFFELETSSPALLLAPAQRALHPPHVPFRRWRPNWSIGAMLKIRLDELKNAFR